MNNPALLRLGFMLIGSTLLAGCLSLKQPSQPDLGSTQPPAQWHSEVNTNAVLDDWIASFGDEQLVRLVSDAITNNPDLEAAAARLDQAIASSGVARAALWPQLTGSFGVQNTTLLDRSDADKAAGIQANSTTYGASLDLSWEVDVWGRLRYANRSATETAKASAADYAAARRSLAAQVAKAWFAAAEAKLQFELDDNFVASYEETLRIVEARFKAGAVSEQDVANAKADLASSRRLAEAAATTLKESVRSLEVLLGRYPAAELAVADDLQAVPFVIPSGVPSQLLERRADIIAAERRVAAAFNTTEAAKAARLPQIALTSRLGSSSPELKDLVDPKNMALNFAGNLCARNAVRKCILATLCNAPTPCWRNNSLATASTLAPAPFGNSTANSFPKSSSRLTNSSRARIEAAATAKSSSALCRCTNSNSRPMLISAFSTTLLLAANWSLMAFTGGGFMR